MREALEEKLERRLKLPVVLMKDGAVAVLDKYLENVILLGSDAVVPLLNNPLEDKNSELKTRSEIYQRISSLSSKRSPSKKKQTNLRLFLCFDQLINSLALKTISKISSIEKKISEMKIIIDCSPNISDWEKVLMLVQNIRKQNKGNFPMKIQIDSALPCPSEDIMNFLVRNNIMLRYVLGRALGYSSKFNNKEREFLETTSGYGLSVSVLFYWSGEKPLNVKGILKEALKLNKLSGISILPVFLSPYWSHSNINGQIMFDDFLSIVALLYSDSMISEFIEEPIINLEERLSSSFKTNQLSSIINNRGEIVPFRSFPFSTFLNQTFNHKNFIDLLSHPKQIPMSSQCKRCAWKHVCAGIDIALDGLKKQGHIVKIWCEFLKSYLRRIIEECVIIRENLVDLNETKN